jgi:hypothetical protein
LEVDDETQPSTQTHGRNKKNSSKHEIKNWAKNIQNSRKWKILQHNIGDESTQKHDYIDANQEFTTDPRRSPPSLPHLIIEIKTKLFLAHCYSRKYKMKLGSGEEPHPLKRPIYRLKQKAK